MNKYLITVFIVGMGLVVSCQAPRTVDKSQPVDKAVKREGLVEKLGHSDFAIARSYLDGFDSLTSRERVTLYYLTRAAIAGRDIYYDQRHRDAIRIREFFEKHLEQNDLPAALKDKVLKFAKIIWINNSNYHARTGIKILPQFSYEELAQALPGEDILWLKDTVFNPNFEPVLTNLTPKPEEGDIIQASANNIFTRGVTLAEIESLGDFWKGKLNVRFDKTDGKIVPQVYKIGGQYGDELSRVAHFLKLAAASADGLQKSALEKLVAFYESGDEEKFREACVDWLKSAPRVDTINGFIESYMDPRQVVGSFEGMSYFTASDPVLTEFSNHVQYFEDNMPWADAYKRKAISAKPVATMINVAAAVGEGGPITWSGINLPNYQDIRSQHGSKNVILVNLIEARSEVTLNLVLDHFTLPEDRELMRKHYGTARRMLLFMHEVIGHGSGAADAALKGDPRDAIGKNYGAWEEARATLVAWHFIKDPKLAEMGAFQKQDQADVVKALAILELQSQLLQLRNARNEDVLREAHDRADQMIFEYLRQNTAGFEVVRRDGNDYVNIKNVDALLKGASDLLKIVHEAKAKGDRKTVDEFLEKYGTTFNKSWRDNIIARTEQIGYPDQTAMIFATLRPVFTGDKISDVRASFDESFAAQQLRFGRVSRSTEISDSVY